MVTSQHENSSTCLQHRHSLCPHLSSPRHVHSSYWCEPVPVRESDQKLRVFAQESLSLRSSNDLQRKNDDQALTRVLVAHLVDRSPPRARHRATGPSRQGLEYHTGEHGFLPVSLSLTSYSVDTAPKFERMPGWWGAVHQGNHCNWAPQARTPHHRASSARADSDA